jgi:hypothetical protein
VGRTAVFRNVQTVIGFCLIGGISAAAVVGWTTGFFARIAEVFRGLCGSVRAWLDSLFGWDHVLAGAGVPLVPLIVLITIFAIADD